MSRLGVVPEVLDGKDLAFAQRVDVRHFQVRLRAIACDAPDPPHGDPVPDVDEVADQFQGVDIPGLAHLLELAHDRLPTCVWPRLRPALRRPPDDARVVQLTQGILTSVPRPEARSHDLHVLLRHRYSRSPTASRAFSVP